MILLRLSNKNNKSNHIEAIEVEENIVENNLDDDVTGEYILEWKYVFIVAL